MSISTCQCEGDSMIELINGGLLPHPPPRNQTVPGTPLPGDFPAPSVWSDGSLAQSLPAPCSPIHGGYAPNLPSNAEPRCRALANGAVCARPAGRQTPLPTSF